MEAYAVLSTVASTRWPVEAGVTGPGALVRCAGVRGGELGPARCGRGRVAQTSPSRVRADGATPGRATQLFIAATREGYEAALSAAE
ncbi:hypothetical protein GCM10025788_02560 [Serinicoccus chungangensis]